MKKESGPCGSFWWLTEERIDKCQKKSKTEGQIKGGG